MKRLSAISGEFQSSELETAFRAGRLEETRGQARNLFLLSAILNALFLFSDWRFHGQPHFYIAVPSRLVLIAFSLACLALVHRMASFGTLQRLMIAWQGVTASSVALLVSSHSEIALFVVLLLPMIFYLVVPISFRWTVFSASICSALLLVGYFVPAPETADMFGLVLALLTLNCALAMAVGRANRLQRLEWSATQSEMAARLELANSRDTLERIFMSVPVPLLVTSPSGEVIKANDAGYTYFGREPDKRTLQSIDTIYVDPADRQRFIAILREDGQVEGFETQIRRGDGSVRDILISSRAANIGNEPCMVSSAVDITDRKLVELHLAQLAMSDALTGLANRSHFLTATARALAALGEQEGHVALMLLDIDEFKQVNDTAGHDAGDALLRAIAARLQASVRPGDVVARLGGDEFAVLLTDVRHKTDLAQVVHRMMSNLSAPVMHKDRTIESHVSIGIAIYPDDAPVVEDLMKYADIALYEAKTRGRARVCMFEPDMLIAWEREAGMLARAREAINEDRLLPYYQPKIDLNTGRIIGFEALTRCIQADGSVRPPADIGAAFEHYQLAPAITDRLIKHVIEDMQGWMERGIDVGHVAINVSSADLRDEAFPDRLLASLSEAGLSPRHFELEVTESVFLGRNAENVERALRLLSAAGMRIALDDFGTGYASLSHLKQFPINVLKIDQRFVRDLRSNPDDAAIVRAVLNLGYSLGIATVAEGVETLDQAEYLRAGGCHFAQGYLYSPAVSAESVIALMQHMSTSFVSAPNRAA